MEDTRLFMTYDSPETEKKDEKVLTCKRCTGETFRFVCNPGTFPTMFCVGCDAEIGRIGWIPKKWMEDKPQSGK